MFNTIVLKNNTARKGFPSYLLGTLISTLCVSLSLAYEIDSDANIHDSTASLLGI